MNYFCFVDESGNKPQTDFFGIGVLIVPAHDIGQLFNTLRSHSDRIKTLSRDAMINRGIKNINNPSFELKFSHINKENENLYSSLVQDYFTFENMRFCAFVMNKRKYPSPQDISHFDVYLNNLAMVLHNNFKFAEPGSQFVILADEITQKRHGDTYENLLFGKIIQRGTQEKTLFGISRVESHASIFIQMTDILLGGVMHSFQNTVPALRKKKVIRTIEEKVENNLNNGCTINEPNYFSIWEYRK